jgi:hypothetical protein
MRVLAPYSSSAAGQALIDPPVSVRENNTPSAQLVTAGIASRHTYSINPGREPVEPLTVSYM